MHNQRMYTGLTRQLEANNKANPETSKQLQSDKTEKTINKNVTSEKHAEKGTISNGTKQ